MAVLFNCPDDISDDSGIWKTLLAALDPAVDFRVWPETGAVEDIEFILAWKHRPGDLQRYPNARAIFWLGAGVDHLMKDKALPRRVPIVRLVDDSLTRGMTEYVLLHVLRHHRRVPALEALQRERRWDQLTYPLARHRKVGLMGLGVLGGDAAAKLVALEFDVAGWSRSAKRLAGVTGFHGEEGLIPFLNRSEILICLLPLTPATAGIINARTLAALPRGAAVINPGRGGHVVDLDLLAALDSGHIAAATLDVFHTEPLPAEHPFWSHPRVTVTPHNAALTYAETAVPGIHAAMQAARQGRSLKNLVDIEKGY